MLREITDKDADKIIVEGEKLYNDIWEAIKDAENTLGVNKSKVEEITKSGSDICKKNAEIALAQYKKTVAKMVEIAKKYETLVYGDKLDDRYLLRLERNYPQDYCTINQLKNTLNIGVLGILGVIVFVEDEKRVQQCLKNQQGMQEKVIEEIETEIE